MKIKKIEKIDKEERLSNIYLVTYKKNLFSKTITEKIKETDSKYEYFPGCTVYINKYGEILGPLNKITTALDNFKRSF